MTALPPELLGRFVQPDRFGKDHNSTLIYVESRVVDHGGWLWGPHLRPRDVLYPTRLADGEEIQMHSDLDCIEDMVMAGWIVIRDEMEPPPRVEFVMRVGLTDAGWEAAHRLRRRKAGDPNGQRDGTPAARGTSAAEPRGER